MNLEIFGENAPLVQEVIDFPQTGIDLVLKKKSSDFVYITNLEEAEYYYHEKFCIDDYAIWGDILDRKRGEILGVFFKCKKKNDSLTDLLNAVSLNPNSLHIKYEELDDAITSDLYSIAMSRAINGKNHKLFELMFKAYKNGGWPCGWEGNWPDGKLVVYHDISGLD